MATVSFVMLCITQRFGSGVDSFFRKSRPMLQQLATSVAPVIAHANPGIATGVLVGGHALGSYSALRDRLGAAFDNMSKYKMATLPTKILLGSRDAVQDASHSFRNVLPEMLHMPAGAAMSGARCSLGHTFLSTGTSV